jgi:Gas vesicle synthesis protein GvpO
MAEQRPVREARGEGQPEPARRRPRGPADGDDRRPEPKPARRPDSLTANEAAKEGLRQISELTGKRPEGVTGLERTDDGWVVGVEVVEDRRIPSSSDILAIYEAEFGTAGDLVSYRRLQRYSRGRGGPSGGGEGG